MTVIALAVTTWVWFVAIPKLRNSCEEEGGVLVRRSGGGSVCVAPTGAEGAVRR